MNITIKQGTAKGTVTAPPSKSYAHRMLICAALADGESVVRGISGSEDMLATMDCIKSLGKCCEQTGQDVRVTPRADSEGAAVPYNCGSLCDSISDEESLPDNLPVYPCRESGSTLRFFIPIALALTGGGIFKGAPRLMERGIGIYEEMFRPLGISVAREAESITVRGRLTPGTYTLKGDVSSQFVSGLLFALPLLEGTSEIIVLPPVESRAYIDITIDSLKQFGVHIDEPEENHFVIAEGQRYTPGDVTVEGDWSNAAFLYAIQKLQMGGYALYSRPDTQICTKNTDSEIYTANQEMLHITGVNASSIQGDRICLEYFDRIINEHYAGTVNDNDSAGAADSVRQILTAAGGLEPIDIAGCPDLGPVLFAFAAACGGAAFTGTRRLRIKESDRAQAMKEELSKFGIKLSITGDNDLEVLPGIPVKPEIPINGHNDHRIVMACAVLMTLTGGTIEGAEAVRKSYPDFFETLRSAGIEISETE